MTSESNKQQPDWRLIFGITTSQEQLLTALVALGDISAGYGNGPGAPVSAA